MNGTILVESANGSLTRSIMSSRSLWILPNVRLTPRFRPVSVVTAETVSLPALPRTPARKK